MKILNNTFSRHLHVFRIYFSSFWFLLHFASPFCDLHLKTIAICIYLYLNLMCFWVNKEMNWSLLLLIFWRRVYGVWSMVVIVLNRFYLLKQECFVSVKSGKNWPSGNVKEYFLKLSLFIFYFTVIFHWGETWPFIWTDLL